MRFAVLASGSRANCTVIEAAGRSILIDCGLSAREATRRLAILGVDPASLDAIFVTHEHSDHITGVRLLSRRYKIPVYANPATAEFLTEVEALERFESGIDFTLGGLTITPFSVVHDAVDPVGFAVRAAGLKFVQATDLGKATVVVRDALRGCHALVLEANHDPELLQTCGYPWQLKQRIASTHGHLSNPDAAELVAESLHSELFHVVLAHLSENSNTPQAAHAELVARVDVGMFVSARCASTQSTPWIEVDGRAADMSAVIGG